MTDNPALRKAIARAVLDDLEDRRDVKQPLRTIRAEDPEVYAEIEAALGEAVMRVLAEGPGPEGPRVPELSEGRWRVGRKLGRTLYNIHGDLVGMMDTPALADRVVDALNAVDMNPDQLRALMTTAPVEALVAFACEANGCTHALPAEVMKMNGEATGYTRWTVPAGWLVRWVHEIAQDKRPAHQRLVVLCPMHGAGTVRAEPARLVTSGEMAAPRELAACLVIPAYDPGEK